MSNISALLALPFLLAMVPLAAAQEHAHEAHKASLGPISVVHAWTTPAERGEDAIVFFEVENIGDPVTLSGGETDIAASVELVGADMDANGTVTYQPLGGFEIPEGEFSFDPNGLGLRLNELNSAVHEGDHFHLHLLLADGELEVSVEVQAAGATAHSHAGHSH